MLTSFKKMCQDNDKRIRMLLISGNPVKFDRIKTEEPCSIEEALQDDLIEASLNITLHSESDDVIVAELKPLDDTYEPEPESRNNSFDDSNTDSSSSESENKTHKLINCESCEKTFTSKKKLESHGSIHEKLKKCKSDNESSDDGDSSSKEFSCDACSKKVQEKFVISSTHQDP